MNKKSLLVLGIGVVIVITLLVGFLSAKTVVKKQQPTGVSPIISGSPSTSPQITSPPISLTPEIDLQKQVFLELAKKGIACIKQQNDGKDEGICRVDTVVGNFAKGIMPLGYWIAVKTDKTWTVAVTGNGIPQCAEIDTYKIPKEIYGNCLEKSGELRHS